MSPLQRCSDISCLLWPIVVCFSIIESNDDISILNDNINDNDKSIHRYIYEVTDGWWFSHVSVDSEIEKLIINTKLQNGDKIIIFSAIFDKIDNNNFLIKLSYNNIRKVLYSIPLGYAPPDKLTNGLSIKDMKFNCGSIFSIKFKVIYRCPYIYNVKISNKTINNYGNNINILMSITELNELKNIYSIQNTKLINKIESNEQLSQEDNLISVLDDVDCSSRIREMIINLNRGVESDMTEEDLLCVEKTMSSIRNLHQVNVKNLIDNHEEYYQVMEKLFIHVLVEDYHSKEFLWLRFPTEFEFENKNKAITIMNSYFLLTNVKLISNTTKIPLYLVNSTSSLSPSSSINNNNNINNNPKNISNCKKLLSCLISTTLNPNINTTSSIGITNSTDTVRGTNLIDTSLRHLLYYQLDSAIFNTGLEISFICTIIDCKPDIINNYCINIVALDNSNMLISMKYITSNRIIDRKCLKWCSAGSTIQVNFAQILNFDRKFDILNINRNDRTFINEVKVINNDVQLSIYDEKIVEASKLRYDALCNSKSIFVSNLMNTSSTKFSIDVDKSNGNEIINYNESCERFYLENYKIIKILNSLNTNLKIKQYEITVQSNDDNKFELIMIIDEFILSKIKFPNELKNNEDELVFVYDISNPTSLLFNIVYSKLFNNDSNNNNHNIANKYRAIYLFSKDL
jgi:hypothetical protein